MILGDFDSVDSGWRSSLGAESTAPTVLYYPRDKDKTDGQLAVEYALDAQIKKICVYGGLGRRFDHTLGNLGLAWLCTTRGAEFHMIDSEQIVQMLKAPGTAYIEGSPRDYVSLIPLTPTVSCITTGELCYPLEGATLYFGETRGLSNELLAKRAWVKATDGVLIIVKTNSKH